MSALPLPGPAAGRDGRPAALADLRVIELQSEAGAFAGKLLADMGADVVTVEPPGGAATRALPPFLDDDPDPERSLHFWHYNLNKRAITLDWTSDAGRALLLRLLDGADVLLEAEGPGRLAVLGLDDDRLRAGRPRLIHVSISAFGRAGPRAQEQATDLTLLAGGGPAWSCGYDDHALPPIAGGGYQGYQTGCHFAVLGLLTALLHRDAGGPGQRVDVNMHAANNVTTEAASYSWLVAQATVQRQTGRHAGVQRTQQTQAQCADGRWVNTGMPPRSGEQFRAVREWMDELGLLDDFAEVGLLDEGLKQEHLSFAQIREDELLRAIFHAGRDAIVRIAGALGAYEFFTEAQQRGFQCGVIYSPEEAMADPQMEARGFPVEVEHPEIGRRIRYPGAPYRFSATPWAVRRRAPLIGEDNAEVYGEVGLSVEEIEALQAEGTV